MPTLKQRAPHSLKVLGRRLSVSTGRHTASWRMTPSFVLAGGQRCGSTSLFRALMDHPNILPPVHHKGVNYFDVGYEHGADWYRGHFPLRSVAALRARSAGHPPMTFEASGYYMYHPHAARRLAEDIPDAKVLVLLRDPIERAYSAYKHEFARGFETESFERALELEDERVEPELARMMADPSYRSFAHRHQSYRRRGQYAEQLQRFVDALGRDRLLVVESADFFDRPEVEYRRITDFLGLPAHTPARFDRFNARVGSAMPEVARQRLAEAFAPHDRALAALTGRTPGWVQS